MKDFFKSVRLIFDDILYGNRVTFFFVLLSVYYILNLLTSPINSGMSGGLEAERNIVNQISAGLFVLYVLYYSLSTHIVKSYMFIKAISFFILYVALRLFIGFSLDTARHTIFSYTSLVNICYWGGGLIFSLKCFKYASPGTLKRMIQMVICVFLVFISFRVFTQKALLIRLHISAGINVAAHTYMIIPLVMLVFKDRVKIFMFLFCAFICLYSAKRQSAVGLAIVTLFTFKILYQSYFRNHKSIALLLLVPLLFFGIKYARRISNDLLHRQERLERNENIDSGRLELWSVALDGFGYANETTHWLGGGPGTGKKYIGSYYPTARAPHNGFIQFLCDYGYIGLFLYVFFFVTLLGYTIRIRGSDNKLIYLSICSSWIFANMISHPGSVRFVFLAIGVGYIVYLQEHEKNRVN